MSVGPLLGCFIALGLGSVTYFHYQGRVYSGHEQFSSRNVGSRRDGVGPSIAIAETMYRRSAIHNVVAEGRSIRYARYQNEMYVPRARNGISERLVPVQAKRVAPGAAIVWENGVGMALTVREIGTDFSQEGFRAFAFDSVQERSGYHAQCWAFSAIADLHCSLKRDHVSPSEVAFRFDLYREPWALRQFELFGGGIGGFSGFGESLLHVRRHGLQGLFVGYHRPALEYRNIAERGGSCEKEERTHGFQNRDTSLVILTLCFVPVLGLGIKLINDGHARLSLFVVGGYLLLVGYVLFLPWL